MTSSPPNTRLSWARLIAFVAPWAPLGAVTLPATVFLPPLYAGHVGLGLVLVGQAAMASRLLDIVIDPFIGAASDATRTRWGRRRPWLIAGAPLFCLGAWFLFRPPADAGVVYFLAALFATYLGSSLILVPHTAWASELSSSYDERSRVLGANEWFNLLGVLAVAALAAGLEQAVHADLARQMAAVGWLVTLSAPLAVAACLRAAPDRVEAADAPPVAAPRRWFHAAAVLGNGRFVTLSIVKFVNSVAEAVASALWVFVAADVLGLAHQASTLLAIHIAMGFVAIPIWTTLSYRVGKRRATILALGWRVLLTPLLLVLPHGGFAPAAAFMAMVGLSLGAESSLLRAMVADVVDQHALDKGVRQAGVFQGTFNVISNLGKALGVGIAYPALALCGFSPEAAGAADHSRIAALFYAFVPPLLNGLAALVLLRFDLSRADVARIQARLAERETSRFPSPSEPK